MMCRTAIQSALIGSSKTTKRKGCWFHPDDARVAAWKMYRRTLDGTRSGLYRRIARVVHNPSAIMIGVSEISRRSSRNRVTADLDVPIVARWQPDHMTILV
jgi:hypothetical protein